MSPALAEAAATGLTESLLPGRAGGGLLSGTCLQPARMTGGLRFEILNYAKDGSEMVAMLEPLAWGVEGPEGPTFNLVPAGFVTDFASMPRLVRRRYPAFGPWARAAIPHDWSYLTKGTQDPAMCTVLIRGERVPMFTPEQIAAYHQLVAQMGGPWPAFTRAQSDDMLRDAMIAIAADRSDGEPKRLDRAIIHRAVRMGGGNGWGR
ncbi:DUF1353 domain-containing protein [Brevundimonas sp.]|uniref:DUF1353 domain-containing protein n=1 Tax=Brevundimonas sp. TaxID=1871086 RepID=UPI002635A891|nr:DUF1353 domain-containing protein [Brevundimonas sp.]